MASIQAPSPSPSTQAPSTGAKRPRPSAAGGAPRAKRRRPEGSAGPDSVASDERGGKGGGAGAGARPSFGVGMVKGKEDEWSDPADVKSKCKIDFMDLPLETLYKYLEAHDLLPRWDVSPWSEERCVPPSQLFANLSGTAARSPRRSALDLDTAAAAGTPAAPATGTIVSVGAEAGAASAVAPLAAGAAGAAYAPEPEIIDGPAVPPTPADSAAPDVGTDGAPPPEAALAVAAGAPAEPADGAHAEADAGAAEDDGADGAGTPPAAPTTRSKTAPQRRAPTPSPPPEAARDELLTLLDVERAHRALADRANQHWMRGLGGGQNKESETIVQFLYKNKVGPGRLLRVYNPATYPYP